MHNNNKISHIKFIYISIILMIISLINLSCSSCSSEFHKVQERSKRFDIMLDSCKYEITINNKERLYILNYKFCNQGCVEIIYPTYSTGKWDTAVVGGNFGIIKK